MGQITNITIEANASLGTTLAEYKADRTPDGQAHWVDRSSETFLGYRKLMMAVVRPKGPRGSAPSRNIHALLKLEHPVLEQIAGPTSGGFNPAPQLAYRNFADLKFNLPDRSTLATRATLLAHFRDIVMSDEFKNLILDYEVAR